MQSAWHSLAYFFRCGREHQPTCWAADVWATVARQPYQPHVRAAQRVQCRAKPHCRRCHQAACSQNGASCIFVQQKTAPCSRRQWIGTRPGHKQAGMRLCRCQVEAAGVCRDCMRALPVSIHSHSLQLCSQASNAVPWLPSLKTPAHTRMRARMVWQQDCTLTRPPCRAAPCTAGSSSSRHMQSLLCNCTASVAGLWHAWRHAEETSARAWQVLCLRPATDCWQGRWKASQDPATPLPPQGSAAPVRLAHVSLL